MASCTPPADSTLVQEVAEMLLEGPPGGGLLRFGGFVKVQWLHENSVGS